MAGCLKRSSRIVKSQGGGESWRGRGIRWCSFGMWRRISYVAVSVDGEVREYGKYVTSGSREVSVHCRWNLEARAGYSRELRLRSVFSAWQYRGPSTSEILALSAQVFFTLRMTKRRVIWRRNSRRILRR